jgi:ceramide glucosyltransferase
MTSELLYKCLLGLLIFTVVQNMMTVLLIKKYRDKKDLKSTKKVSAPISVLLPVKGPYEGIEQNLKSFFEQDYAGKIEWVFAFQDGQDSCIPKVKAVSEQMKVPHIKILEGVKFIGLNPKNSNLTHAYLASSGEWLLTIDIDCFLPKGFIQGIMDQTGNDPKQVVTTVPIHYGARNLWSCLESIGTNVEMMNYFVSTFNFKKTGRPVYGGGLLFHRKTGEEAGAFGDVYLNSLTEDAYMQGQFQSVGANINLAHTAVETLMDEQSWSGYTKRYIRWLMIGKYFIPPLFYITPIFWFAHWSLIAGLITMNPAILMIAAGFYLNRMIYACAVQAVLRVPSGDILKGLTIFVYDMVMPYLWLSAFFKRTVVWAGTTMAVQKKGRLVKV